MTDPWDEDDVEMPCPSCGAAVYDDAEQCPRCGHWILDAERHAPTSGGGAGGWLKTLLAALSLILVLLAVAGLLT